ncbi:hypothetical protein DN748_17250 [Sinomicrobium soli]|nr:hypothetical protein DN748_17250 [Sinomicrobium sp. N-1-3-6]RQP15077.1 MAG: nuclear transport factor 2 family protein [Parapedobacter sp.]
MVVHKQGNDARMMTQIIIPSDCGNAPKKNFLKDFYTAWAKDDLDFCKKHLDDHIIWEIVGQNTLSGIENFEKQLQHYPIRNASKMVIETIITHGTDASVDGQIWTNEGAVFAFCDVYKFKGFKGFSLKSIKSFWVELPTGSGCRGN